MTPINGCVDFYQLSFGFGVYFFYLFCVLAQNSLEKTPFYLVFGRYGLVMLQIGFLFFSLRKDL